VEITFAFTSVGVGQGGRNHLLALVIEEPTMKARHSILPGNHETTNSYDKRTGDIVAKRPLVAEAPPALPAEKRQRSVEQPRPQIGKFPSEIGRAENKLLRRDIGVRVDVRKRQMIFERIPDRPIA